MDVLPMPTAPSDPTALAQQLDETKRREAAFRLQTIQLFRSLDQRLRETHQRAEDLSEELGRRNTYIHELHLERIALRRQIALVHDDVAAFTSWLSAAEEDNARLRESLARRPASWWSRLVATFTRTRRAASPAPVDGAPAVIHPELVYYLHTSPFRVYREPAFTLRGWVYHRHPRPITGVRARLGDAEFIARAGLEEPEVVTVHHLADGPHRRPGFEIDLTIPPGRHRLVLEAQLEHRDWCAFLATPIWSAR